MYWNEGQPNLTGITSTIFCKYFVTNIDSTNDMLNYELYKYTIRKVFFAWKYLKMSFV